MKRFLPIIIVVAILAGASYYFLFSDSDKNISKNIKKSEFVLGEFNKNRTCAKIPTFLYKLGIKRPLIDLSQQQYTGVAFYYGKNLRQVLHKKEWEKYEYMGTYAIDPIGDIYLAPNPFISIKPTTFNLQKAIYKMDSKSGELSRWMVFDDVEPTQNNPYGIISVVYDCTDNTLWASSIDKSSYKGQKGRIYHIKPQTKEILQKVKNFDALTISLIQTKNGRYLLAGNAMDSGLYAFKINANKIEQSPIKLFDLPNPNLHIRKIKVIGKNSLKVEAIKFNYSLVAETNKKQRFEYIAIYNPTSKSWQVKEKSSH